MLSGSTRLFWTGTDEKRGGGIKLLSRGAYLYNMYKLKQESFVIDK